MSVLNFPDPSARSLPVASVMPDRDAQALGVALRALCRATRLMTFNYEEARLRMHTLRCAALESLLAAHLIEQRRLLNVLEERLRGEAGGHRPTEYALLCASTFHVPHTMIQTKRGTLERLRARHDWLLRIAAPSPRLGGGEAAWTQDFAVGRYVLSNDLQRAALIGELQRDDCHHRSTNDRRVWESRSCSL